MYEQRADRPVEHDRPSGSPTLMDAANLPRSGMVPSWITRISWGSVFAATFVVVALQFALTALSIWGNFGFGKLTTIGSVSGSATTIAVWTGIWAAIALFIGGLVVAALSNSRSVSDGVMHALVTWGVSVASMTILSAIGVAGLLGFGLNSGAAVRSAIGLPTTALSPLTSASAATGTYAGYYLLFSGVGLITAVIGGVGVASAMRRRRITQIPSSVTHREESEVRRAA